MELDCIFGGLLISLGALVEIGWLASQQYSSGPAISGWGAALSPIETTFFPRLILRSGDVGSVMIALSDDV